jgi:hypothetical protein
VAKIVHPKGVLIQLRVGKMIARRHPVQMGNAAADRLAPTQGRHRLIWMRSGVM